jgi:hypothetical protein
MSIGEVIASDAPGQNKTTTIIVNGQRKTVTGKEVTFDQIVILGFGNTGGPETAYTVTFRKGEDSKKEGTLVKGESVKVKEGEIFDVTPTGKS